MQAHPNQQVPIRSDAELAAQRARTAQNIDAASSDVSFDALLLAVGTPTALFTSLESVSSLARTDQPTRDKHAETGMFDDAGRADIAHQLQHDRAGLGRLQTGQSTNTSAGHASDHRMQSRAATASDRAQQMPTSHYATQSDTTQADGVKATMFENTSTDTVARANLHTSSQSISNTTSESVLVQSVGSGINSLVQRQASTHTSTSSATVIGDRSIGAVAGAAGTLGSQSSGQHGLANMGAQQRGMFHLKATGAKQGTHKNIPEHTERVAAQIKGALGQILRDKGGKVTIRLSPESLGTVRIELQMAGGSARAVIEPTNEQAMDMLKSSLPQLRETLEKQGVHVESLDVRLVNAERSQAFQTGHERDIASDDTADDTADEKSSNGSEDNSNREHDLDTSKEKIAIESMTETIGPELANTVEQYATAHSVRDNNGVVQLRLDAIA